jgi:dTDP-glucose 4,6-dehydratase
MSKRILITGIGGSIGCHALQHFMKNTDWEIIGIDSFSHRGLTDRLKDTMMTPRVQIYRHDLTAPISGLLRQKMGHIDYVLNLASISDVDASIEKPSDAIRSNVDIAINMLDYAREASVGTFMQVSTDEVYGPTNGITSHSEWDPIVPSNPYSASKACQEAISIAYWRSYGVPLIIVNLMNNFGEMQSPAKYPAMVQRKVRNGDTLYIHKFGDNYGSRFYIHSRNSADAFMFLFRNRAPYNHVSGVVDRPDRFNIVGDRQIDNLSMAQTIAVAVGKPLRYKDYDVKERRPGHDAHYGLNGTKLRLAGWTSPYSFDKSMRKTVRWYEENPEWLDAR